MQTILTIVTTLLLCHSVQAADLFAFSGFSKPGVQSVSVSEPKRFDFKFPDLELVNQHDEPVSVDSLFNNDKNVVFAFFFTQCVTVCTTVTLSLKSIQTQMAPDTQFVLISIDPEVDTPDKLADYAATHHIHESNWHLLTGELKPIIALQRSFKAYRGNKMNHTTSLFVSPHNSSTIFEIDDNFSVIPGLLNKTAEEQGHAYR